MGLKASSGSPAKTLLLLDALAVFCFFLPLKAYVHMET